MIDEEFERASLRERDHQRRNGFVVKFEVHDDATERENAFVMGNVLQNLGTRQQTPMKSSAG